METTRKEYRRTALIITLIFLLSVTLLLLLMSLTTANPPFPPDKLQMVELDFSGGGATEGATSNETTSEETSSNNQPEDPVNNYEEPESPVSASDQPTSNGSTNNDNTSTEETNDPANDFSNVFGGGNNGSGTDDNGTNGQGGTDTGPSIGPQSGRMGSGRGLLSKPDSKNPIEATGKVRVKIFVKRDGTVDPTRTQVLHDDPKTTSPHKAHWDKARELANKFKFEPVSGSHASLEYKTITIEFTNS